VFFLDHQSFGDAIDVVSSTPAYNKLTSRHKQVSESDSGSSSEENKSMLFTALCIIFINSVFV
jgi:hypothetical protein